MRVTLSAAASKGGSPTVSQEATVERDGANVYIEVPRASGVISAQSAITFGEALITAAGGKSRTSEIRNATLEEWNGGYVAKMGDAVLAYFEPRTVYVQTDEF